MGVHITNRIVVGIELEDAITFHDALRRLAVLRRFISLAAGCPQRSIDVQLVPVTEEQSGPSCPS